MTTHIDKQALLDTLTARVHELNRNPAGHTAASVLEDLDMEIRRNQYAPAPADEATPQQDPLEAAADRVLNGNVTETVRNMAVGDVVSVSTILHRRALEHEQLADEARKVRAVFEETVQGALSAETQDTDPSDEARIERLHEPSKLLATAQAVAERDHHARLYNETGLRDRNGGR